MAGNPVHQTRRNQLEPLSQFAAQGHDQFALEAPVMIMTFFWKSKLGISESPRTRVY
jgi:hypothetical protein